MSKQSFLMRRMASSLMAAAAVVVAIPASAQSAAGLDEIVVTARKRAEKNLDFIDANRSYVINYGLGLDMVRAYVEAAGPGQAERWARMRDMLSGPTVPADLEGP